MNKSLKIRYIIKHCLNVKSSIYHRCTIMTRLKVVKVTIQYFDKGSQLSNTSQNSVNVRTWEGRLPVQKQSCITPCEEDRELLVQMSDGLTPILPSLPCLGRGQLLHLSHCLVMPAPQSLPWHGDEDHPLPHACLPIVGTLLAYC